MENNEKQTRDTRRVVAVKMQQTEGEIGDFYGNIIMPKRFQRNMMTT